MKRLVNSILVGIFVFGGTYFAKTMGLQIGATLATRLTPPPDPLSGNMLLAVTLLPFFMGTLAGIFFWILFGIKNRV